MAMSKSETIKNQIQKIDAKNKKEREKLIAQYKKAKEAEKKQSEKKAGKK